MDTKSKGLNVLMQAPELTWLLDHELTLAERYLRFVSLLLLQPSAASQEFRQRVEPKTRRGDVVYDLGESTMAVLMSETDARGANIAFRRYLKELPTGVNVAFGIGSFPEDGGKASAFLSKTFQRLNESERMTCDDDEDADNDAWRLTIQ